MTLDFTRKDVQHNLQILEDNCIEYLYAHGNRIERGKGPTNELKNLISKTLRFAQEVDEKNPIFFKRFSDDCDFYNASILLKKIRTVFSDLIFDISAKVKWDFSNVVEEASRNDFEYLFVRGKLGQILYLLNHGKVSQEELSTCFKRGVKYGLIQSVWFLISDGRVDLFELKTLTNAVIASLYCRRVDIAKHLLADGRINKIPDVQLSRIIMAASTVNEIKFLIFLLSEGRADKAVDGFLGKPLCAFSKKDFIEGVQFLLTRKSAHTIFTTDFEIALSDAANNLSFDMLKVLLSNRRSVSTAAFDLCAWDVIFSSRKDYSLKFKILKLLFQKKSIYERSRLKLIDKVREDICDGDEKKRLLDLLDSAPSVSSPSGLLQSKKVPEGIFEIDSFENLQEDPEKFLTLIADKGIPRCVVVGERLPGEDLGVLTGQFVVKLLKAGHNKIYFLSDTGLPCEMGYFPFEKSYPTLEKIGQIFHQLEVRNRQRWERFLTGSLFSEAFYRLVMIGIENPSWTDRESTHAVADVLKNDPSLGLVAKVVLDPENEEQLKEYAAQISSHSIRDAKKLAFDNIFAYAEGVNHFIKGLGHTRDLFKIDSYEKIWNKKVVEFIEENKAQYPLKSSQLSGSVKESFAYLLSHEELMINIINALCESFQEISCTQTAIRSNLKKIMPKLLMEYFQGKC